MDDVAGRGRSHRHLTSTRATRERAFSRALLALDGLDTAIRPWRKMCRGRELCRARDSFEEKKNEELETLKGWKKVNDWTIDEVGDWLEHVELPAYRDVFKAKKVDGQMLRLLESSDLQLLLGMVCPLDRIKLMKWLDQIRDDELLTRGWNDSTEIDAYLGLLDLDRVTVIARLKSTFDRLDTNHDGLLDLEQVKDAFKRLESTTYVGIDRLVGAMDLSGNGVSFPAFVAAFSKLAQGQETFSLPRLDLAWLRLRFKQYAGVEKELDEGGVGRFLKELGYTQIESKEEKEMEEVSMTFAQFVTRYVQLMEPRAMNRLEEHFFRLEPLQLSSKPVHEVVDALGTLFPMGSSDQVSAWKKKKRHNVCFHDFVLVCLTLSAEKEDVAACGKAALGHRSRVVYLQGARHVRLCPQNALTSTNGCKSISLGQEQEAKEENCSVRQKRRKEQINAVFDRFLRYTSNAIQADSECKSNEHKPDSLNPVEAAQAALELGAALSRAQVLHFLACQGTSRAISRVAFHRLMQQLDGDLGALVLEWNRECGDKSTCSTNVRPQYRKSLDDTKAEEKRA